jgi:hypothetical protein
MSSHAGSQNLPFFAPSCLRSTYATDNPIPIKDRMASERPGSPLRHLSMSPLQAFCGFRVSVVVVHRTCREEAAALRDTGQLLHTELSGASIS